MRLGMRSTRLPATALRIAVGLTAFLAGCQPNRSPAGMHQIGNLDDTIQTTKELARAQQPLTKSQLAALLSPPDRVTTCRELPALLRNDMGSSDDRVTEVMSSLHRGFGYGRERLAGASPTTKSPNSAWDSDAAFLSAEFYWYALDDPQEVELGGIVPRRTGVLASAVFTIWQGQVIDGAHVYWKRKPAE